MAASEQTVSSELSLDLSQLLDSDPDDKPRSRDIDSSSSDQDDMEEVVISDTTLKQPMSTKLDLSALVSGSSSDSSGPRITRDRVSSLPAVSRRPFVASEAWSANSSDMDQESNKHIMQSSDDKTDSVSNVRPRIRQKHSSLLNAEKLPCVNQTSTVGSYVRQGLPERGIAFGSSFLREPVFQRHFGRLPGQSPAHPPFLRAHAGERRLQAMTLHKQQPFKPQSKPEETVTIERPKDFATLHLLARRAQGHLKYKYMAWLNEWIAEHGVQS